MARRLCTSTTGPSLKIRGWWSRAIQSALRRGEPEKAAVFAYEKGATMNGEFLAPARRVGFFLWQDTFDQLRPEGLALFRAAVLWVVSPPE